MIQYLRENAHTTNQSKNSIIPLRKEKIYIISASKMDEAGKENGCGNHPSILPHPNSPPPAFCPHSKHLCVTFPKQINIIFSLILAVVTCGHFLWRPEQLPHTPIPEKPLLHRDCNPHVVGVAWLTTPRSMLCKSLHINQRYTKTPLTTWWWDLCARPSAKSCFIFSWQVKIYIMWSIWRQSKTCLQVPHLGLVIRSLMNSPLPRRRQLQTQRVYQQGRSRQGIPSCRGESEVGRR